MTAFKRCCAWVLTLVMLLALIPGTAFAVSETDSAALTETTVANIANDVAKQVIKGSRDRDGKIQLDSTPRYGEDDEVEIIVVVDNTTAAPMAASKIRSMLKTQERVAKRISTQALDGARVEPEHQYTTLFNGFSTTVTYGEYQKIRELSFVESAFISPTFELVPATANSNQMIGGGLYNKTGFNGEGMLIAILDTGVDMTHKIFSKEPTSPSLTKDGLKQLLANKKFQATEIVSGLSVEDLYKSAKFPFQFDYGDKDRDGLPGTKGSHGTHVASTAAGCTGINDEVMGVAPEAQIVNMNVFKSSGGASYSDILCALEDCIALGVDVANLSLGSDAGYVDYDSEDELTKNLLNVFEKVGESGTSLAVAAGNAYSAAYGDAFGGKALATNPDYGLSSEPSTYAESMSVAAVSNAMVTSPFITVGEKKIAYQDSALVSEDANAIALRTLVKKGEMEYAVVPGTGTAEDFAKVDVNGKIALVERGGIYYQAKMDNAKTAGAIGMLVYNNTPGMLYMSISNWEMPSAFISQAAGEYMKKQETKTLTVSAFDDTVESPITGMADFSSWGATTELVLKPEITAPGAGIYAAVPGNGYESMDGTSMASPHVAGGMAIVQQALKARGVTDAGERKHLTDTLLMSTAHILYDENGHAYSPRKQGAGLMSIADAVNTKGYLSVEGQQRPKLELKDDPEKTGVYTMRFTVHNTGDETLYYNINPIVLTDGTTVYENSDNEKFVTSSESAIELAHTFTTNCENNRVAVAAGKTAAVTVTVTLTDPSQMAAFTNGAFVDGFVTLTQVDKDGGELADSIDLGVPFLAFYGDWTVAPIMDSTDYWETLDGSSSKAQAYMNTAFSSSSENTVDTYIGENSYAKVPYLADRNAISPNDDDFKDSLSGIYTGLLRNTKSLKYTITGENGEVYYSKVCDYVAKSIYSYDYYRITPAGVDAEYDGIAPWYGTDAHNSKLPNNTKATVRIEATLPYGDGGSKNLKNSWEFPITVDTEEPEAKNLKVTESEGRYYLNFDVTDNQYVAAVIFYNVANHEMLYGQQGFGEMKPGMTSHVEQYDVTGMGETIGMIVHDYAGNSKSYNVKVPGNPDDHVTIVPTDILWTENFNDAWLPDGWSVESKSGSPNTWYRGEDYTASIDYDDDYQQNEWLYSRTTDLSGVETETHMIFDFYTTYWYTVEYKHCNLLVMASDDGTNWEEIWNLQRDSGLFTAWTKTQAKVTIPEKFQSSKNLRFAFVYTGKGGSALDLDNVVLYSDVREDYIEIDATAGEGGTITPEGKTLVKKGTSKTFTIAANEGYEIENVRVDGVDQGPISYYTFERVGQDHTISVTFKQAQTGGEIALFDNNFDAADFPGQGWTVKKTNSGYSWHQARNTYVSTGTADMQAIVDPDEYDEEDWSSGAKQDELLISPVVDLTGKAAKLSFNYGFARSALYSGKMTFTVEASTDGGKTWSAIWNAKNDVENGSGYFQTGLAEIDVPAAYQTAGVQFAFRYYKPVATDAGYVAIDNAKLTVPGTASGSIVLTTLAGEGGTVSPKGQTQHAADEAVKVTFTPDSGYQLKSVKLNGRTVDVSANALDLTMDQSYCVSAEFKTIPDVPTVYFENDFESIAGDIFPFHGWKVKTTDSTNKGYFTWKQYGYYGSAWSDSMHAYITNDWNGVKQDELLISPAVDLSGTRDAVLSFEYAYGVYGAKNKTYTATVEASVDGGQTWKAIWNFQDSYKGQSGSVITGSAEVKIPADYAVSGAQFAFHYVNKNDDIGQLAIDNVKLKAVQDGPVATQYTITAQASEGGTITPNGEVSVREGASQTFEIKAASGYEIADVLVDGQSVGVVETYTFENVTAAHTISASFKLGAVEFDNDFEQDDFPGHGWTVKSTHTDPACTWYVGTNRNLNTTRQARIDLDYLYDDSGDSWSVHEVQPASTGSDKAQDEYLISPAVDLTGKSATLSFDYLLHRSTLFQSIYKFTVEASTDGGKTWNVVWNAAELPNPGGWTLKGPAEITVPEEYLTAGTQFAFHFAKKARTYYTDNDCWNAIDNIKLTYGSSDPCADGHTLVAHAEEPATCTEPGKKAYWSCEVCGKLFLDAEGKNETTADALVIPAAGHNLDKLEGTPATCTEPGKKEAWKCSVCQKLFADSEGKNETTEDARVIPAKGHNLEGVAEIPASCTATGTKAYWKCLNCQKLFSDSEGKNETSFEALTIPAKGHSLTEVKEVPATCTEAGKKAYWKCEVCQKIFSDAEGKNETTEAELVIPASGHKLYKIAGKPATCNEPGIKEHWQCSVCKKLFSDSEGKHETTEAELIVEAKGHKLTEVKEVPATCTETGKKAYWKCSVCKKIFSDAEGKNETTEAELVIEAKGHKLTEVKEVPATCTESGKKAYWKCEVCQKIFSDSDGKNETTEAELIIPAAGHDFTVKTVSEKTLRSAATYAEKATYWYTCSVCGALSDTLYFEDGEVLKHEIKGDESWTKGTKTGVTITVDDESVTGVQIDGKVLSDADYTLKGKKLTIKAEVLEKLSVGKHTVTVTFEAGSAECSLTVKVKAATPTTGDETSIGWLIALTAIAGCGIIALILVLVIRKKNSHKDEK